MRIAFLTPVDPGALGVSVARGLLQAGAAPILTESPLELRSFRKARVLLSTRAGRAVAATRCARIGRRLRRQRPDAIVVIKALGATPRMIDAIREGAGCPVWNLFPDNPFSPAAQASGLEASLRAYNGVLVCSPAFAEELHERGVRAETLPFGLDEHIYFPPSPGQPPRRRQATFVGAWSQERQEVVRAVADVCPLQVGGPGWSRRSLPGGASFLGERLRPDAIREAHWRSLVGLNIFQRGTFPSFNMRSFEIPGTGTAMVCSESPELRAEFRHGAEAIFADTPAAFASAVEALLADPARAKRIGEAGLVRAQQGRYATRASTLVRLIASCSS